jgi:glycosyltransferase involved in cell wall biosynthesis
VQRLKQAIARRLYKVAVSMKKVASIFLPVAFMQRVKSYLLKLAFPVDNKNQGKRKSAVKADGINLIGYARAEMGIGESCRIMARSLLADDISFGIINFEGTSRARMNDLSFKHKEINMPLYDVNVFHVNAEQMVEVYAHKGEELFNKRYNIGYWHWELPDFPERWIKSFGLVDEIWAPSTFIADAISLKSPVPVIKIPHSIEVNIEEPRNREYFGLPATPFMFLVMYDVNSYQQRKNPQAAIEAFKLAFKPDDLFVGLVIKVNVVNPESKEMKELQSSIKGYENVFLIKEVLKRNDINALLSVCDSFVSLHRSEGFGLGLAEAMYLGKPVIGTNWSANTDFMTADNSCPVDFRLVKLEATYGPYESYQQWAEPDVLHASRYMKNLVQDEEYRQLIAQRGQHTIHTEFSPEKVGELVQKRLNYIRLWNGGE